MRQDMGRIRKPAEAKMSTPKESTHDTNHSFSAPPHLARRWVILGSVGRFGWLALAAYLLSGCAGTVSSINPDGRNYYACMSTLDKVTYKAENLQINLLLGPGCAMKGSSGFDTNSPNNRLYCDELYSGDTNFKDLIGAIPVLLPYRDADRTDTEYIRVGITGGIPKAVYVAFDERVNPPPTWLSQEYFPKFSDAGDRYYIETTILDKSTNNRVKLLLWQKKQPVLPAANPVITFGGNSAVGANGGAILVNNLAMYVILIRPKNVQDPSVSPAPISIFHQNACWSSQYEAEQKAKEDATRFVPEAGLLRWEESEPPYLVSKTTCVPKTACPADPKGTVQNPMKVYPQHSRVVFEPTVSNANIEVLGKTYNQPVTGTLDFVYGLRADKLMAVLKVNGIIFDLGDIGEFKNTALVLTKPFEAECSDIFVKIDTPCDRYTIKADTISALAGATFKGNPLLSFAGNPQALNVDIDHTTRTFRLKTPPGAFVTASVKVDGEEKPIKMKFDLTGHFENLPPVPTTKESRTFSQCIEGTNTSLLRLDAAGSFDIYPSGALDYRWYEDFGLPTEKLRGNTSIVQIFPHTLSYGVYSVALVLRDGAGGVAFDNLDLVVGDTESPFLQPPPDVYGLSKKGLPLVLDIGIPYSKDSCSSAVRVTHNAPSSRRFSCGETVVTWSADDYNGNITEGLQRVKVFCAREKRKLKEGLSFLEDAIRQAKSGLDNCDGGVFCRADLSSLGSLVKTFAENFVDTSGKREQRAEIEKDLRRMASILKEIEMMYDDARRLPEVRLRRIQYEEAASQLEKVRVEVKMLMER